MIVHDVTKRPKLLLTFVSAAISLQGFWDRYIIYRQEKIIPFRVQFYELRQTHRVMDPPPQQDMEQAEHPLHFLLCPFRASISFHPYPDNQRSISCLCYFIFIRMPYKSTHSFTWDNELEPYTAVGVNIFLFRRSGFMDIPFMDRIC